MAILVLGINHKTASVALREKVAFSDEKQEVALWQIRQQQLGQSAVILSTCNRTEIYIYNSKIAPELTADWNAQCVAWFADFHQIDQAELQSCLYLHQNQQAAQHLMRVACGLDSLILGEPQILGQVKEAYHLSENFYRHQHSLISSLLSRLFQKTFATAKRVRNETNIGESAVSVAYAACCLSRQIFENLNEINVLLVGAGETIELVARHLLRYGAKKLIICNRTLSHAESLVEKLAETNTPMEVQPLEALKQCLTQADVVISSTGSPLQLITLEMVKFAQQQRRQKPMLIVDIAVPRDVEESVGSLDSIYYYSVDDLNNIIQFNLNEREKAAAQADAIIAQEVQEFFTWLKVHQSSNLIREYRHHADAIRQELLQKAMQALSQGESAEKILKEFSQKLTNKLLHTPTQVIQSLAKQENSQGLRHFSVALKSKNTQIS